MAAAVFCLAALCLFVGIFYPYVVQSLIAPGAQALANILGAGAVPAF